MSIDPAADAIPSTTLLAFKEGVARMLDFPIDRYRDDAIDRRVAGWLSARPSTSPRENLEALARQPALREDLVAALTIHVTSWCRDPEAFEALRTHVLPELVARHGHVSVWSAGCADGAEIHSVVWAASEAGLLEQCSFLATDISSRSVARAREGTFGPDAQEGMPEAWREQATEAGKDGLVRIVPGIRARVAFEVHDLLRDPMPPTQHLIVCRNVTIHMQDDARDEVWARLGTALPPGGMLFVGNAEHLPPDGPHGCRLVRPFFYEKT